MPLELALRPRIRLDERPAISRRRGLPPLVVPITAYWLGTAALTYHFVKVAPGEVAPEARLPATAEPAPLPRPRVARAAAEPPERAAEDWAASTSFDPASLAPVAAPPEPAPVVAETPSAAPREPLSVRFDPAEPDLPVATRPSRNKPRSEPSVPLAALPRSDEPARSEPAPEPHRWLFDAPPAAAHRGIAPNGVPRESGNAPHDTKSSLPSCEAIAARANQEIDLRSGRYAPDLSREALGGVLDNGSYLTGCNVPDRTALDICVAVQAGRVQGVTVVTRPANAGLAACVRRTVSRLSFPSSPRLDITRTRFETAR